MNRKFKQVCLRLAVVILMAVAVPFQSFAANAKIAFSDPSAEVGGEVSAVSYTHLDVYKRQMHAMGPNVAGVIGTAVAAGTFMAIFGVG